MHKSFGPYFNSNFQLKYDYSELLTVKIYLAIGLRFFFKDLRLFLNSYMLNISF